MKTLFKLTCVVTLGLLVAGGVLSAGDDPKTPSPNCPEDYVQYFPLGPEFTLSTAHKRNAVLGDLLFTDVVSVHFVGLGHPANPDGSLGGLVVGDFAHMKIYERYIVREVTDSQGRTFREMHAYEALGRIEQRFPSANATASQDAD